MQICQDHWHELKNAIRRRGMWKLVSPDTVRQLPAHVTKRVLTSTTIEGRLDPLSMATLMICEQALAALGAYIETLSAESDSPVSQGASGEAILPPATYARKIRKLFKTVNAFGVATTVQARRLAVDYNKYTKSCR